MISMVAAVARHNVIGAKNKIPWLLRADLVRLKKLTQDKVVILGRKTYDSMVWYYDQSGRDMPGKQYIVITKNPDYKPRRAQAIVAHSTQEAIHLAKQVSSDELFVIGGAAIFAALLPFADKLYITEIDADIEGDTYFPALKPDEWRELSRQSFTKDDKNQFDYAFVDLVRKKD